LHLGWLANAPLRGRPASPVHVSVGVRGTPAGRAGMASSFACRDDDLGYAVDLFVGHRRECVNGGVDRLAVSVSER